MCGWAGFAIQREHSFLTADGRNQPKDAPYRIGQVWDISYKPMSNCVLPHVEDVIVFEHQLLTGHLTNVSSLLPKYAAIHQGGLTSTFDGCLQFTPRGSAYISIPGGIPTHSVCFWQSKYELRRDDFDGKTRYSFSEDGLWRHITFVGYENSGKVISPGTILRLSLARWWHPKDGNVQEDRCYLQLSGYYH